MNPPQITLKLIVLIHFILTVWVAMNPFLGTSYLYMNFFILSVGMWSIAHHDSSDTVLMLLVCELFSILHDVVLLGVYQPPAFNIYEYLVCQIFSILQDIILLGLYEPDGYKSYEQGDRSGTERNVYRFALGMSIVNLIIKPVTAFLIYRIYQERGGSYADFSLPSHLPNFGGGGGGGGHHGGNYENIDEPIPPNNAHIDDHPTGYNDQEKVPQH